MTLPQNTNNKRNQESSRAKEASAPVIYLGSVPLPVTAGKEGLITILEIWGPSTGPAKRDIDKNRKIYQIHLPDPPDLQILHQISGKFFGIRTK